MRVAKRAASGQLGASVTQASDGHPAKDAYSSAQEWAAKTKEAVEAGDDDRAKMFAGNAKKCAAAARTLLRGREPKDAYPDPGDPAIVNAAPPPRPPEEARAAQALAGAAGIGGRARLLPAREDGGQSAAWNDKDFAGSATVYPATDDEPGYARVVFHRLDEDQYQALADSPWPYRTENGQVIYDQVPVDHAEQIIHAASRRRPAKPWEEHGLSSDSHRATLDSEEAAKLWPESQSWAGNLSNPQKNWFTKYTNTAYKSINQHLYEGKTVEEPAAGLKVKMKTVTKHLDAGIEAAGVSETPHRVYRGFTPPTEVRKNNQVSSWVRENFVVGGRYRDDSYMSVSHCPSIASGFSRRNWSDYSSGKYESGQADHGVVFEAVTRRGAPLASVSRFNNFERERLMPRNTDWVVVGVHEDVVVGGKKVMLVQLCDAQDSRRY
ncbi:ADP-ribosyltransferase (plasmid) [Streptomyces sp. NBC_00637]|uniref:ADP-ribosyltransferase n=1 Tax=Streptomyces sp. NBC_00637 TaxID=2903667 RepID=UPI00324D2C15